MAPRAFSTIQRYCTNRCDRTFNAETVKKKQMSSNFYPLTQKQLISLYSQPSLRKQLCIQPYIIQPNLPLPVDVVPVDTSSTTFSTKYPCDKKELNRHVGIYS